MFTRPDDDLKKYAHLYFVTRGEDRMVEIRTKYRISDTPKNWCTVYAFSDSHLAILLPNVKAGKLLRELPETFREQQKGIDGTVLVFEESHLPELADTLKLRRRRKPLTPEQVEKMTERLEEFQFKPQQK